MATTAKKATVPSKKVAIAVPKPKMKYAVIEMPSGTVGSTPGERFRHTCESEGIQTYGLYVMYTYDEDGEQCRWYDTPKEAVQAYWNYYYSKNDEEDPEIPIPEDAQGLLDWTTLGKYVVSIPASKVPHVYEDSGQYKAQDLVVVNSFDGKIVLPAEDSIKKSITHSMDVFLSNIEKDLDKDSPNAKCDVVRQWDTSTKGQSVATPLNKAAFIEGIEQFTGLKLSFVSTDEFLKVAKKKNLGSKEASEMVLKGLKVVKSRVMKIGTILPLK